MTGLRLTLEEPPGPDEPAIRAGLRAFNRAAGWPEEHAFAVLVRDPEGAVCGGARCAVDFDVLYVDSLWLDEAARGCRLGTQVMDLAEAHGRRLGARLAWLDTMSWQARPFYEKRGYRVFAELAYDGGAITRYWLRKDF